MLDAQATAVLDRLYAEDAAQRAAGLPSSQRTRNVDRETGEWLNLLIRATGARNILEIGGCENRPSASVVNVATVESLKASVTVRVAWGTGLRSAVTTRPHTAGRTT